MIELPEAYTIARQIEAELKGKKIQAAVRGNWPHKFAFYNREPEEYEAILGGRAMGEATERGSLILVSVEPDYVLMLGGGGERILHSKVVGLPCPECGTPIERISFLGGTSYFCPSCQT